MSPKAALCGGSWTRARSCGFFRVEHLPAGERPDGLRPVPGLVG